MKKVIFGFCVAAVLLAGSVAKADAVLSTLDGQMDSWGSTSFGSTVLAAGDGAYAGERLWHTYIRFDLPTLAAGESFSSAELLMYPTGFHSWTSGDPATIPAQFRVYETVAFDSSIVWATQPSETGGIIGLVDAEYYGMANINSWVGWDVLSAMGSGKALYLLVDNNRDAVGGGGGGGFWFHSFEQGWGPRIEYTIVAQAVCSPGLQADFNDDCKVDFQDLFLLVSEWAQCNWSDQSLCQ